ncbi:MAG: ABC transporter permease [Bacteroidetes bacterium]|nr:ABC transporter permease [Bacteroidota bacterium]
MKKILLIIRREYLTRVKKRSFIVMTILGPLLMAAVFVVPIYLATNSNEMKNVAVLDQSGLFFEKFKDSDNIKFHYITEDLTTAKENFPRSHDYALLFIPKTELSLPENAIIYSSGQVNINVKSYVSNVMSRQIEELKLEAKIRDLQPGTNVNSTTTDILKSIKSNVDISTIKLGSNGEEQKSYPEVSMVLGMFSAVLIYFFIFMFGSQVMRGVIEEKTSRIIEVIISSVKPFQLMMGKIIGVALVGLTQFMLWVILTFGIVTIATSAFTGKLKSSLPNEQVITNQGQSFHADKLAHASHPANTNQEGVNEVFSAINSIDFPVMIGSFLFYFLFGYLLYAALFAAIGSAVDSESDTQQFMLPITMPLIFAFVTAQYIIQEPQGPLAFWLSIIPLTSPVVMMVRIPFGVPVLQVILSMILLLLGFVGTTWMAGKIYRTGILMYGKKVNYKELWKWLKYKN